VWKRRAERGGTGQEKMGVGGVPLLRAGGRVAEAPCDSPAATPSTHLRWQPKNRPTRSPLTHAGSWAQRSLSLSPARSRCSTCRGHAHPPPQHLEGGREQATGSRVAGAARHAMPCAAGAGCREDGPRAWMGWDGMGWDGMGWDGMAALKGQRCDGLGACDGAGPARYKVGRQVGGGWWW